MDCCVRVAVIADHLLFRAGIAHALRSAPRLRVVAEGDCFADAVALARDPTLDLLLLEIEIPGSGLQAAKAIRQSGSKTKIAIITALESDEMVIDALRAGANGYILKDITGPDLALAIGQIHDGRPYISPALASRLLNHIVTRSGTLLVNRELVGLSKRERQVLDHLARGLTNREIARELGITLKTIKQHASMLFSKMGVRNRMEASAALHDRVLAPARPDRPSPRAGTRFDVESVPR